MTPGRAVLAGALCGLALLFVAYLALYGPVLH